MVFKTRLLHSQGITQLFPFQETVVEFFDNIGSSKKDLVVHAPTGSGKTFAYALGLALYLKKAKCDGVIAVVLVPTQALAEQTMKLVKNMVGRKSIHRKYVIDTPESFFSSSRVNLIPSLKFLVIDEADRLANELYKDYLEELQRVPTEILKVPTVWSTRCKRLLCSATYSPDGFYADMFDLINPETIFVNTEAKVSELRISCNSNEKYQKFEDLMLGGRWQKILVFVNSIPMLKEVSSRLLQFDKLHGKVLTYFSDMPSTSKAQVIEEFDNASTLSVLISTDALARGVDIKNCDLVVNYEMPQSTSSYIHRIGRTGRGAFTGTAISFTCNPSDERIIRKRAHICEM